MVPGPAELQPGCHDLLGSHSRHRRPSRTGRCFLPTLEGGVELLADQSEFVKVCLPAERFFSRSIILTAGTSDFFSQYTKDLSPQNTREHGYKTLLLASTAEAALL